MTNKGDRGAYTVCLFSELISPVLTGRFSKTLAFLNDQIFYYIREKKSLRSDAIETGKRPLLRFLKLDGEQKRTRRL